jgi:hypothetical protein
MASSISLWFSTSLTWSRRSYVPDWLSSLKSDMWRLPIIKSLRSLAVALAKNW